MGEPALSPQIATVAGSKPFSLDSCTTPKCMDSRLGVVQETSKTVRSLQREQFAVRVQVPPCPRVNCVCCDAIRTVLYSSSTTQKHKQRKREGKRPWRLETTMARGRDTELKKNFIPKILPYVNLEVEFGARRPDDLLWQKPHDENCSHPKHFPNLKLDKPKSINHDDRKNVEQWLLCENLTHTMILIHKHDRHSTKYRCRFHHDDFFQKSNKINSSMMKTS